MTRFLDNLKNNFKNGNVLIKIIFINAFVYIALMVLSLFLNDWNFQKYIALNVALASEPSVIVWHPWTIFTYMFVHFDFFHVLFNMIFLYGFGQLFLNFFSPKNLGSLYILGGVGGGILFILAYNFLPFLPSAGIMVGASASAMAIVFAVAFYVPNMYVNMFLLGRIKILYIALGLLVIDLIFAGTGNNQGGHISHIGGALIGFLYAKQFAKGKDITRWLTDFINKLSNLFKPRQKKTLHKTKFEQNVPRNDYDYNGQKAQKEADIDKILDKIKASGYSSLTKDEKKQLFDASKK